MPVIRKIVILSALILSFTLTAYAETEEFVGKGEYFAEPTDSIQKANDMALQEAVRRVSEQAAVALKSRSEIVSNELTNDEVAMVTVSVIRIKDRKFNIDITPNGVIKSTVTVIAEVDTDEAEDAAKKLLEEKVRNNERG
ncbi:MAG: hypothetical protein IKN43_02030 [Selenomonadaceae bacterium]|nr:hypothetical protein [Selenomonadaceae bacterium]